MMHTRRAKFTPTALSYTGRTAVEWSCFLQTLLISSSALTGVVAMSLMPQPRLQQVAVTLLVAHQPSLLILHTQQLQTTPLWGTTLSGSNHRPSILNSPSTRAPSRHGYFRQAIPRHQVSGLISTACASKTLKMVQMGGKSTGGLRLNSRAKGKCPASRGTFGWL